MTAEDAAWVLLARLVRTQGRHGELLADVLTDFPERFAERRELWLLPPDTSDKQNAAPARAAVLERHWPHKGRLVLKFAGIDSISDAETLAGWRVAIRREERMALRDDSVYIDDLIGCRVVDEADGGAELGVIEDVVRGEGGAADLLVVAQAETRHSDGHEQKRGDRELLIPFARAYLVEVNVAERVLRMRLPAGLAAIDAPLTDEERARQATEKDDGDAL